MTGAYVESWREAVYILIGLLIGVVFHEYMHGRAADYFGDKTARSAGRLTLNPIAHIDPFGTVLLPLALLLVSRGSFTFGYAKPVPVNPFFMKRRRDMVLVALSGPLANFTIAIVLALTGLVANLVGVPTTALTGVTVSVSELFMLLYLAAYINVWLGVFNLIPIPPLDGSHVLEYFLPDSMRESYERIAPFGFIIVFAFLWLSGSLFFSLLKPVFQLLGRIMGIPSYLL